MYANNESWNGSSWTEVNDANVAKRQCAGQTGTGSSALLTGGTDGSSFFKTNEQWNGNNWVELADMSVSGGALGGAAAADSTAAIAFGGGPPYVAATEEWSSTSVTTKVLTD